MSRLMPILGLLIASELTFAQDSSGRAASVRIVNKDAVQSIIVTDRVVTTEDGDVRVKSITMSPAKNRLRLVMPKNSESGGASLGRYNSDENGLASFTGSFLASYSPVIAAGLVWLDKTQQNELRPEDPVMTAVVCYADDLRKPVTIMSVDAFSPQQAKGDCIQTGPVLVGRNETDLEALDAALKNFPYSRKAFDRAFILLDAQGNVVMGVSERLSLFVLREVLRRPERDGGFGAIAAVALSGTRSAGLIVGNDTAGNVRTLLPNAVVITPR
jgi:hypothetical protein